MHDAKRRQPALSCVWRGNISIYSETQMPYGYCSHADVWHPSCLWTFQNSLQTLSLIFPHLPSSSGPSLSHDALLADSLMPSSWRVLGGDACPPAVFSGWTLTYSSRLNLGLSALEGICNKALPPCRDERDTGESINFQTCRVKGCLSSQQDTFKLRYNLRTKTKVAAWPSCVRYDLWLAMSPLQVLAFPHIFQVKGSKMCVFRHVWLFANLWTVAGQAPLSLGFSRQEYWNGSLFPPPGSLPDPGSNSHLLCLLHCSWILLKYLGTMAQASWHIILTIATTHWLCVSSSSLSNWESLLYCSECVCVCVCGVCV